MSWGRRPNLHSSASSPVITNHLREPALLNAMPRTHEKLDWLHSLLTSEATKVEME